MTPDLGIPRYSLGICIAPGKITWVDMRENIPYHNDDKGDWCRWEEVKEALEPVGFWAKLRWLLS